MRKEEQKTEKKQKSCISLDSLDPKVLLHLPFLTLSPGGALEVRGQVNCRERQALKGKRLTQQGSPSFGGRNSLACRSSSLDLAVSFFSLVPIPEHRLWKQKPHQPNSCEQSLGFRPEDTVKWISNVTVHWNHLSPTPMPTSQPRPVKSECLGMEARLPYFSKISK